MGFLDVSAFLLFPTSFHLTSRKRHFFSLPCAQLPSPPKQLQALKALTFPYFSCFPCDILWKSEGTTFNTLLRKLLTCSLYATASCESERREGRESREGTLQFFTTQSKLRTDSVFARFQRCDFMEIFAYVFNVENTHVFLGCFFRHSWISRNPRVVSGEAGLRDAERLERRCCACARRGRGAWLDRGRGHRPARELGNRGIPKESQPSHHCHRGESMPSYISNFFHYFFKMFRLPSKVERWQSHLASVFVDLAGIKGI